MSAALKFPRKPSWPSFASANSRPALRNPFETLACYPLPIPAHCAEPTGAPAVVKAFVLIVVDPAKTIEVYEKLRAVEGISEVYQVMGPYDIVAVVEVPSLTDVPAVISRHIRAIEGIESTTTCVTFPEAAGAR
ncbi:Lrp/AsnC family transcriptional regulator [Tepidiforma bonchosmolovskayae]|uniref:Lrp/AsnC family transcriptional regulator n=1 Tax=Tepidiforma bonchosmolovskayae TaxID=2601677 RepID=A0ABX6C362_9CHLR|nr:Lrp/AsnC family transcriptional regulator [Tepidiforma bonchosmolovskayae]